MNKEFNTMATRKYEGRIFNHKLVSDTLDTLSVEEALQININGSPFTITMRTPGDDNLLVRGLLHSEGVLTDTALTPDIILKKNEDSIITEAELRIAESQLGDAYSNSRSLLSVSSCGICGKTELDDISSLGNKLRRDELFEIESLHRLLDEMSLSQLNFKESGGTHAAVAFNQSGLLLSIKEDIGRHNAVDKVIGDLIYQSRLKQASFLTVSGRISYEIIIKCFKAGIPCLAAVSAPSSLAVDYAKELGITLLAFCREQRATCYANSYRIQQNITLAT